MGFKKTDLLRILAIIIVVVALILALLPRHEGIDEYIKMVGDWGGGKDFNYKIEYEYFFITWNSLVLLFSIFILVFSLTGMQDKRPKNFKLVLAGIHLAVALLCLVSAAMEIFSQMEIFDKICTGALRIGDGKRLLRNEPKANVSPIGNTSLTETLCREWGNLDTRIGAGVCGLLTAGAHGLVGVFIGKTIKI